MVKKQAVVGNIEATVGLQTSSGKIVRITEGGTVFTENAQFRRPSRDLTVPYSAAHKRKGYVANAGAAAVGV